MFDKPFEDAGFCVVRGPDLLHGRRQEHMRQCRPGTFSVIIGGPPCQPFSKITSSESLHADHVAEFWRIVDFYKPDVAIMEEVINVHTRTHPEIPPGTHCTVLRDWDCGGFTQRVRGFWHRGFIIVPAPHRDGTQSWSVLARSWDKVVSDGARPRKAMLSNLKAGKACALQGFPEFYDTIKGERRVVPDKLIVHMQGNGVPRSMGEWVVRSLLGLPHPVFEGQQMALI